VLDGVGIGSSDPDIYAAAADEIGGEVQGLAAGDCAGFSEGRFVTGIRFGNEVSTTGFRSCVFRLPWLKFIDMYGGTMYFHNCPYCLI